MGEQSIMFFILQMRKCYRVGLVVNQAEEGENLGWLCILMRMEKNSADREKGTLKCPQVSTRRRAFFLFLRPETASFCVPFAAAADALAFTKFDFCNVVCWLGCSIWEHKREADHYCWNQVFSQRLEYMASTDTIG